MVSHDYDSIYPGPNTDVCVPNDLSSFSRTDPHTNSTAFKPAISITDPHSPHITNQLPARRSTSLSLKPGSGESLYLEDNSVEPVGKKAIGCKWVVKDHLYDLFTIKDIRDARYILGLEIARNPSSTYLAQTKYVLDITRDAKLLHSKVVSIPFPQGLKLTVDCGARPEHPNAYH
ncbi:UNVERIFIED_CONTAM: hypothetical protein Scaly_2863900 [Sesamum calycinum]|uniref:Reverse transcriptase Ty1/copia-type domain-containing protein n=1 Tax=Sesamum calycinum TaxID=2727403 RepID=A0AAW2LHM0_9LAMI